MLAQLKQFSTILMAAALGATPLISQAADLTGAGATFPATLTLAINVIDVDGKRIKLTPGMNLTAEIKTGKRRVIEYFLSPLLQHGSESLRER